jgi:rhamnogalacturonyl hydrolase YesR
MSSQPESAGGFECGATAAEREVLHAAGNRIAERIVASDHSAISYTNDLALEALLPWAAATGEARWRDHVAAILALRGTHASNLTPWRREPFASLSIAWYEATQDETWLPALIAEGRRMVAEIERDADGIVLHPRGASRGGGFAVLIDSGQEFISRCAWTAARSGDQGLADEAARQAEWHRDLLRESTSGMWSQGRGWLAPGDERLSPGTWSRGQGWVMRGLGFAARILPADWPARARIAAVFTQLADDLLARQAPSGLWHATPHLALSASGPETSGSGLIAAALRHGAAAGLLTARHDAAAQRAIAALLPYVDADGVVHQACYGPGPLQEAEPWLKQEFPPGDHHGPFSVLGALAAGIAVTRK